MVAMEHSINPDTVETLGATLEALGRLQSEHSRQAIEASGCELAHITAVKDAICKIGEALAAQGGTALLTQCCVAVHDRLGAALAARLNAAWNDIAGDAP
jgi:hypothetical protein